MTCSMSLLAVVMFNLLGSGTILLSLVNVLRWVFNEDKMHTYTLCEQGLVRQVILTKLKLKRVVETPELLTKSSTNFNSTFREHSVCDSIMFSSAF